MPEKLRSISIIILLISVIVLVGIILYLRYRRRHTRERFAFLALLTISTLAASVILPILHNQSIWGIIAFTFNEIFNANIPIKEPTFAEQALAVLVLGLVSNMILKIHQNWRAELQNKRQQEDERQHALSIHGVNSMKQMQDVSNIFVSRTLVSEINQDQYELSKRPSETPWHIDVAEILMMISQQYQIEQQKDWYQEQKCYISAYGKNKEEICIYCCSEEPSVIDIQKLLKFIDQEVIKIKRIIIAVEKGDDPKIDIVVSGWEIEKRYRKELISDLVDFSKYINSLKKRFYEQKIYHISELKLKDIIVPRWAVWVTTDQEPIDIESEILKWSRNEDVNRHFTLLGHVGSGKSTLALKISMTLIEQNDFRVPILIDLSELASRDLSNFNPLEDWAKTFEINYNALLKLHREGRLLVIFDGFDKMNPIRFDQNVLGQFETLWSYAKPRKSKILMTGSPHYFESFSQLEEALKLQNQSIGIQGVALALTNLSESNITTISKKFSPSINSKIMSLVHSCMKEAESEGSWGRSVLEIFSNPLNLVHICTFWHQFKDLFPKEHQVNFALIVKRLLEFRYEYYRNTRQSSLLTKYEMEYLLTGIAVDILKQKSRTNKISSEACRSIIDSLLLSSKKNEILSRLQMVQENRDSNVILVHLTSSGLLTKALFKNTHSLKFASDAYLQCLYSKFYVSPLTQQDEKGRIKYDIISQTLKGTSLEEFSKLTLILSSNLLASELRNFYLLDSAFEVSIFNHIYKPPKVLAPRLVTNFLNLLVVRDNRQNELEETSILGIFFSYVMFVLFAYFIGFPEESSGNELTLSFHDLGFILQYLIALTIMLVISVSLAIFSRQFLKGNDGKPASFIRSSTIKIKIWYLTCRQLGLPDKTLDGSLNKKLLDKIRFQLKDIAIH